jgi:glycosyltransferase involved in cell wall biosynthesis
MVAFHFPPFAGGSGVQRTLRFVQHLPALGWEPLVLSANPMAYEKVSGDLLAEVPNDRVVNRAWALDSSRHLSLWGHYFAVTARPDRWASWKFDAVRQGLKLIREYQPDVIWSTYPIATAHIVGDELSRISGIPWIVDFRDPMAQEGYPADPKTLQQFSNIEARAIMNSALATFTTPSAVACYRERYPQKASSIELLENGYDEESFKRAERLVRHRGSPLSPGFVTLLHSGIVYPEERDPDALFQALKSIRKCYPSSRLRLRFRASTQDGLLREFARRHEVEDKIELLPALPYAEALAEMMCADGLLVLQAANCNAQIPAKLYEYFRAGRPIVALTDPIGDTAKALRACGFGWLAPLDDAEMIGCLLAEVEQHLSSGRVPTGIPEVINHASRTVRSKQLAAFLNRIVGKSDDQAS